MLAEHDIGLREACLILQLLNPGREWGIFIVVIQIAVDFVSKAAPAYPGAGSYAVALVAVAQLHWRTGRDFLLIHATPPNEEGQSRNVPERRSANERLSQPPCGPLFAHWLAGRQCPNLFQ